MTALNWTVSVERQQRLAAKIRHVQGQLRAERRRQLQQYGEFVERAGLTALPPAALFGLLLEGAQQLHDAATVQRWHEVGSHTFARAAAPALYANSKVLGDTVSSQGASVPAAAEVVRTPTAPEEILPQPLLHSPEQPGIVSGQM